MTDKALLTELATDIQNAINTYDPKDTSSRNKIQTALETMQKMIQPPEIALIEQWFRVHFHPSSNTEKSSELIMENRSSQTLQNICILAAIEMGLFKLLGDNKGKNLTVSDLAAMSGYNEVFVCELPFSIINCFGTDHLLVKKARIMRMMTAIGCAEETGYQSYTANEYTICQNRSGAEGGFIISYVL